MRSGCCSIVILGAEVKGKGWAGRQLNGTDHIIPDLVFQTVRRLELKPHFRSGRIAQTGHNIMETLGDQIVPC